MAADQFVSADVINGYLWTSPNAQPLAWTDQHHASSLPYSVANNFAGVWIAAASTAIIYSTDDGDTWSEFDVSTYGSSANWVTYNGSLNKFLVVDEATGDTFVTTDSSSWTRYAAATVGGISAVGWSPQSGYYLATGESLTDIYRSVDGQTWTSELSFSGAGSSPYHWCFGHDDAGGVDICVMTGAIYRSTNGGDTWTAATVSSTQGGTVANMVIQSVGWNGTTWAALGYYGSGTNWGKMLCLTSTDGGVNWDDNAGTLAYDHHPGAYYFLFRSHPLWDGTTFWAFTNQVSLYYTSTDGVTWDDDTTYHDGGRAVGLYPQPLEPGGGGPGATQTVKLGWCP